MANEADVVDLIKFAELLEDAGNTIGDLEPVLPDLIDIIQDAARDQIDTSGGHSGTSYRPLEQSTIDDRLRKGFSEGPPLVRTGDLRDYVSSQVQAELGANGFTVEFFLAPGVTNSEGVDLELIAGVQDFTRPIFDLNDSDLDKAEELIGKAILGNLINRFDEIG